MPFLTANKIHNGHGWLPDGTVIEVSENGTILSVQSGPNEDAIFYEGVLSPGFVNVHCHLELSHMKSVVGEHTGLIPFLKNIPQHRNDFTEEQKKIARHNAHSELLQNGVIAIGDIANTTDSFDLRELGQMHFSTFVESLGFNDAKAPGNFGYAINSYKAYSNQQAKAKRLKQSIVPHAPYSVSSSLFRLIDVHEKGAIISIHNQESIDEDTYYKTKQGGVPELLQLFGIDDSGFVPSGKSSLQTYLKWMSPGHPFIFVHNTCSLKEDVQFAHSMLKEAFWCLCPNANLYIENKLPDINMFISEGANICIGTDSLASNHQLCILSELYTIKKYFPHLHWELLLTWATNNGAHALQMHDIIGSIDVGKTPGIILLKGLNQSDTKPSVKRII